MPPFKAGCIKYCLQSWQNLTSDPNILSIVQGCKIEFDGPIVEPRNSFRTTFSVTETPVIEEELDRLLAMGAIKQVPWSKKGFLSSIFTTPKKDGSTRMILNLKKLNESVEYHHFKMDTLEHAVTLLTKGCLMASIDLRNAYHSIPMHQDSQKFLQFQYGDKLFQYTFLLFGSSAPRFFMKVLKTIFATLRELGHLLLGYLDDTILLADSVLDCEEAVTECVGLFQDLGFVVHEKKNVFQPTQSLVFLGFVLNSINMTVTLTTDKKANI